MGGAAMARTHTAAHGPRAAPRARAHAQGASEFSQGEFHTPSPRGMPNVHTIGHTPEPMAREGGPIERSHKRRCRSK
jgi:hypothetical protein